MVSGEPFWINREHDRLAASPGLSRYGAYTGQRVLDGFAQCWDGTVEDPLGERFALLAWRIATTPATSPPYVNWRSPVLSAKLGLDADGGSDGLIATVEVASPWPYSLRDCRADDYSWCSWPRERSAGSEEYFRGPYGYEVAHGGYYALASLRLVFPVPVRVLPAPPGARDSRGEVKETARQAVAALVAEFNRTVWPVISALERS